MKYVLDTNAISALMKGDAKVIERLKRARRSEVGIPQPVVAEIEYGLQRLARSKRRDALLARFELLKADVQRLPWTDEVSVAFGAIKAALERRGERIEDFDAAVAAHAQSASAILVTANIKHMARVPDVTIEDWG
jgi:tRNA(fMet)-specific endonuclease VapC